jgi:CTP synthase (UTP-ammonia lyase)
MKFTFAFLCFSQNITNNKKLHIASLRQVPVEVVVATTAIRFSQYQKAPLHCRSTMFATKFAVNSIRNSAAISSCSTWRAFSNTAATFADQYDVVIVGKFEKKCDCGYFGRWFQTFHIY